MESTKSINDRGELLYKIFEGCKFEPLIAPISSIKTLFSLPHVTHSEDCRTVYVNKLPIAILVPSSDQYLGGYMELTPGFALNTHVKVFKTYNKLIKHFISDKLFLTLQGGSWWVMKK